MGTGDRQHMALGQQMLGQPLRPGNVVQTGVEHVLDGGNPPLHRIADDHNVRRRLQMRRGVPLHQPDAGGFQLRTHGWIDVGIRAGHAMAQGASQERNAAHEGAADTKDVQVHVRQALG
jgi:hypothetical protein